MARKRGKRAPGTGSVTKLKNGKYVARITIGYDANGNQIAKSRTRPTSQLAHEALDELREEFKAGRFRRSAIAITKQPVPDYLRWWFTTVAQPTLDPNSERAYEGAIKRLAPLLPMPLGKLTHTHVTEAVAALRAKQYAPATIELTITVLKSALAYAVESEEALKNNVAAKVKLDPVDPPPPRVFTVEEAPRFLDLITTDRREALWLVGTHGLGCMPRAGDPTTGA